MPPEPGDFLIHVSTHTHAHIDRHTQRYTHRHPRDTYTNTNTQRDTQRHKRDTYTNTDTHTDIQRDAYTNTDTQRDSYTNTDTQRHTHKLAGAEAKGFNRSLHQEPVESQRVTLSTKPSLNPLTNCVINSPILGFFFQSLF